MTEGKLARAVRWTAGVLALVYVLAIPEPGSWQKVFMAAFYVAFCELLVTPLIWVPKLIQRLWRR